MYLRFIRLVVREGSEAAFQKFYRERVIPTLSSCRGCVFAGLLTPWRSEEHRSLTLWRSCEDARAYEEGGLFQMLLRESMPYLSARTVWRARLAEPAASPDSKRIEALETLGPERAPRAEEIAGFDTIAPAAPAAPSQAVREIPPEGYEVAAADVGEKLSKNPRSMFVRVVAIRVRPERRGEFESIYERRILPAMQAAPGCVGIFLAESSRERNEALSITVWEREESAVRYEMTGEYERLVQEIRPTLSPLSPWQLALGEASPGERRGAGVATYQLVHGRKLGLSEAG
jgi:heme-degrading monooxygenase HmoA